MNFRSPFDRKQLKTVLSCFFFVLCCSANAEEVSNGVLDLRDHKFGREGKVPLDAKWAFYWKELYSPSRLSRIEIPPDYYTELSKTWEYHEELDFPFSEYGYATYNLKVLISQNKVPPLAISMPATYCSYRLWVNGKVFLENGVVAKNKETYEPHWLPMVKAYTADADTIDLVLQIANFDHFHGGISQEIYLGDAESIFSKREKMIALDMLLVGILLMVSLIFFALYFMGKHEKEILFFAIFCFVFVYRVIGVDQLYFLHSLFPNINWRITLHLEYFTMYLSVYLFTKFIRALYPKETDDWFIKGVAWISIAFAVFVTFAPVWLFTWASQYYLAVIVLFVLYTFYIYIRGLINKKSGSVFGLVSIIILGVAVWLSVFSYLKIIDASPLYFSLGFLGFIFFQALILTFRFSDSLHRAKNEAEQGARSKSEFLATMSHEIRTPLNGVLGMSDLLESTRLDHIQKEYVSTIKISGENLLNVINDILDFSKIESGKLSIDHEEVNIYELLDDVLAITSTLSNDKKLELFYVLDKNVPEFIWIDKGRLKQVLVNLVNNALKFTESGYVSIHVKVNDSTDKDYDLRFEVKDTGIGIPETKRSKLFKAFSQVDSSTSRKYGGTGLGLAICKQIVELMDGRIEVESKVGAGSLFYFNIRTQKIVSDSYFKHYDFSNKKVGFAFENEIASDQLCKFYENNFGFDIICFDSLESFNKNYESENLDVLIFDAQLLQDQSELSELIQNVKNTLPLILLSRPMDKLKGYQENNMLRVLNKPIRITILMEHLRELFSLAGVQSEAVEYKENIEPTKPIETAQSKDLGNVKILLAEDNEINQKVMTKLLEAFGASIDIAEDGEEAVKAAEKGGYDLIFMDMQMPEMDGIEATIKIREMNLAKSPIIIALTANVLNEDIQKCLNAGMDEYLSKPLKKDSLERLFKRIL